MNVTGKRALITGGSSGIGRAVGVLLAGKGASVWLLARGADRLGEACSKLEAERVSEAQEFGTLQADVADAEAVDEALGRWQSAHGAPHIVVNSAGITRPGYVQELGLDVFRAMMDVNYFGMVHVTQFLLKGMLERGSGHIVNISSGAGLIGVYGYSAYGASKFAVRGYTDVLRAELKPHGLQVSLAFPPDTDTPQLEYENQFKPPLTKQFSSNAAVMSAETVAESIVGGIERRRYLIFPGWEMKVVYWLSWVLGPFGYPVIDYMLARARRQLKRLGVETGP